MKEAQPQTHKPSWDDVREAMREQVGENVFARWFQDITADIEDADGVLRLCLAIPNQFHRDWICQHHGDTIKRIWGRFAPNGTVTYTVQTSRLPAKVIQLALWPEVQRGVPNEILRSALFAAIAAKDAEYMEQRLVATYDNVKIKYTGKQLSQSDLDVWEQVVHLARGHPLGTVCHFAAHGFLKSIGRSTGKANHQWLHSVLLRLTACAVEIYKDKRIYARSLLTGFDIDESSRHIKVSVDPDMIAVYAAGWTGIDWAQRQKLRKKPLALWLHGYYATHASPLPVKVDTLRRLCGSHDKTLRSFRQKLRMALEVLASDQIRAIQSWRIDSHDLVHVERGAAISASQQRHLESARHP